MSDGARGDRPPSVAAAGRRLLVRARQAIEGPDGPPLAWTLRGYRPAQLSRDVAAGLTIAALTVPLSIGYASVAGLPPEVGLYASIAPLIAYAVFGSGRRLVVGPDASTAALIAASIAPLAAASDDRVRLVGVLALMVAGIFIVMRLGRMGFLADFLSRPILVGYMTGVGITVALGQIEKIAGGPAVAEALGVLGRIDWSASDLGSVVDAVRIAVGASGADLISLALGVGVAAAMLLGRRHVPRVPMALVAMLVTLGLSALLDLQSGGVQVLGPVPSGLPSLQLPVASPAELVGLLPGALGLAILSFADTAATGRTFAARHGERTDANRELVALAAADASGALTGGYAVSSSPSRTAAAEAAGSSSQFTGLVAAAAVAVVLVLLTGPLSYLPTPALGAVIFVSVLGLIDLRGIRRILDIHRSEGLIAFITMAGVILYGTLIGVAIAVLLAALNIVRRAAWPQIVEVGRLPNGTWRDLGRGAGGRRVAGVITVRFTGPMFFANATALQERVRRLCVERPDAAAVILDLGAAADIDVTAGGALRELADDLAREGRRLVVARPLGPVRDELRLYGLADLMEATGGTHGSIDAAVTGLALDPGHLLEAEGEHVASGGPATAAAAGAGTGAGGGAPGANSFLLRVLAATAGVVAIAAVAGALIGVGGFREPSSGTVPNLVGLPLGRAQTAAASAGFVLDPPVYVARADRPEGTVVAQEPRAGTVADQGAPIQPIVSTGRGLVRVPDVSGLPEAQAIAALTGAGLSVRRAAPAYDLAPAGEVLSTNPPAGTSVATGTTVSYLVSAGPAPTPPSTPPPSASPSGTPSSSPEPSVEPGPASPTPGPSPEPSDASPSPAAPTVPSPAPPSDARLPSPEPAP
jgi:sulfate permease, SulP family